MWPDFDLFQELMRRVYGPIIGALTFLLVCFRANLTSSTARGLDLLIFSTITGLLIMSIGRFISRTNFSASRFMSSLTGKSPCLLTVVECVGLDKKDLTGLQQRFVFLHKTLINSGVRRSVVGSQIGS